MTALLLAVLLFSTDPNVALEKVALKSAAQPVPASPSDADVSDVDTPAALYVPRPDALRAKLKGSPLQGFSPWFATKTATHWPWVVIWDGQVASTPKAFAGTQAQSDPWVRSPGVSSLLAKPADLMGTLDLTYFFRDAMRGTPQNDRQVIRRLGVESLQTAHGFATLGDDHAINTQITLRLSKDNRGLFDALGPPAPSMQPAGVPPKANEWWAARVIPAKVWEVAETVAGLSVPIQYGLARAQLDVLEDSMKVRWREDILGYAPRTWAAYTLSSGERVAVLEIQKGTSAAAFVRETLSTLREIFKELTFQETKTSNATRWIVRAGTGEAHIAVAGDNLIIANASAALDKHLAFHGTMAPMRDAASAPAVAWGMHDDAHSAHRFVAWGHDGVFRTASKAVGANPLAVKDALKNAGRSEWWMDPIPEGFGLSILSRPLSAAMND